MNTISVLLIEDDPTVQRGTKMLLRRALGEEIIVDVATTATAAMSALRGVSYEVILSDFDLGPGGSGGDVLVWLRAYKPDLVERFIFFSGSTEPFDLHSKVIEKGIWFDDFREQLLHHLEGLVAA